MTVSRTASLTNEMVHVSWTGFTPSSDVIYDQAATDYPVMVAQCRTVRPRSLKQCYGADNGGVQGAFGPFGPMNTAYATTARNGTGQLDIQIVTLAENQFLGCGVHHRCSLVIVPSQGGDTLDSPTNCRDHSLDTAGTDVGQFAFSSQTGSCSFRQRIVVPLSLVPAPESCPLKKADFAAIGSPIQSAVPFRRSRVPPDQPARARAVWRRRDVPGADRRIRSQRHDLGDDQVDRGQCGRCRVHEGAVR